MQRSRRPRWHHHTGRCPSSPATSVSSLAAAGVARQLAIDVLWVPVAFVLLRAGGGWGFVLYGASWAAMTS